jgi:negative regulator of sigma E activity
MKTIIKNIGYFLKKCWNNRDFRVSLISFLGGALITLTIWFIVEKKSDSTVYPKSTVIDSLSREIIIRENYNDTLKIRVKEQLIEKNKLNLQMNLLKYKFKNINANEKNIQYFNDSNSTIESVLDSITSITKKYPIDVQN